MQLKLHCTLKQRIRIELERKTTPHDKRKHDYSHNEINYL